MASNSKPNWSVPDLHQDPTAPGKKRSHSDNTLFSSAEIRYNKCQLLAHHLIHAEDAKAAGIAALFEDPDTRAKRLLDQMGEEQYLRDQVCAYILVSRAAVKLLENGKASMQSLATTLDVPLRMVQLRWQIYCEFGQ